MLNKTEIKTLIKNIVSEEMEKRDKAMGREIKRLENEAVTLKDVKNMIRKTIVQQYKYLWEKSSFFINQI